MSHDHDQQHAPLPDGGVTAPALEESDAGVSWKYISKFAKSGTGKASELPFHASRSVGNDGVIALMPQVAKRTTGEIVLECAAALGMPLADQIDLALGAQRPIADAELLHHLRNQSPFRLGKLDERRDLILALRKKYPGPLGDVLPALHDLPLGVVDKRSWVNWFLDTMDPTVAAVELARPDDAEMLAKSLDAVHGWGWLDHFHLAASSYGGYLGQLRDATKDKTAKQKLTALVNAVGNPVDGQAAERAAQVELGAQLDKQDDAALVDAAARTHGLTKADPKRVASRLAGKEAGVVLEYVLAAELDAKIAIDLLLAAQEPQSEALRAYFRVIIRVDPLVDALADDRLRNRVRKNIGREVGLLELFAPTAHNLIHRQVIEHEALRQWVFDDKHPAAKLWLAAGSADGARRGCRLVKSERGLDWVEHLPFDSDQEQLRRFALNATDARATKLVRDRYLRDGSNRVDASETAVVAIDQATYGQGDKLRVKIELGQANADPATALARIADLTPKDRHELLGDAREMKQLFGVLVGDHVARAVYLLEPTVSQLLALPIAADPGLISYVAARPAKEDLAALASATNVAAGRAMFGETSPLIVFPSLRDASLLATALADNDALLEWILADTDPNSALALLSRDPVRKVAASVMENRASAFQGFPAYAHLLPEGKRGIDAITKQVGDAETKSDLEQYQGGDVVIPVNDDKRGKALAHAAGVSQLWTAIAELAKNGGDKANVLELVRRAPSAQQVALLDGSHAAAVDIVRDRTHLGPQHVFPALPLAQLLALPGAADWLVADEAPTTVLALLAAQPAAIKSFATYLEAVRKHGSWVVGLPRGGALMAPERQTLDEMCKYITHLDLLKALFRARFDVEIQGTFDFDEVKKLWGIARRLPPAQMNQQAIHAIVEKELGPSGQWAKPDIEIDSKPDRFKPKASDFNAAQKMTADEVKKYYGLSDKELAIAATKETGWLDFDGTAYTVKPIPQDAFTNTVLHEIGHSIDTMLGEHTDLIFGAGGWHVYGVDQFETWANEMGALDAIDAKDRPKVIEVWKQAMHANTNVSSLVDGAHPALSDKYAASPLVKAAKSFKTFYYEEHDKPIVKGRAFFQNVKNVSLLYSIPQQTYQTAPSTYSFYNAPEFFAESYVEYYRLYDGTPNTEKLKGGKLASWIKTWFDQYVDKIRLNPARVRPPATK